MEDEKEIELKLKINNLIWMHSPDRTTLEDAEKISLKILELINRGSIKVGI